MPLSLIFSLDHLARPEGGQKGEEASGLRAV